MSPPRRLVASILSGSFPTRLPVPSVRNFRQRDAGVEVVVLAPVVPAPRPNLPLEHAVNFLEGPVAAEHDVMARSLKVVSLCEEGALNRVYVLLPLLASVTVVCARSDRRHPADRCSHLERPQLPEEGAGKYKRLRALLAPKIHQPRKQWPRASHRRPSTSGTPCRPASCRRSGGGRVCWSCVCRRRPPSSNRRRPPSSSRRCPPISSRRCSCPCRLEAAKSSSCRLPCCRTWRQKRRHVATRTSRRQRCG